MLNDVELHLVETFEDATRCLEWLSGLECEYLGFDTETTGLSPETDSVRLVQFGDRFQGWAIPIDRWWGLVAEIVTRWRRRGRFVGHNARFDVAMLRGHGIHIPVELVDDTLFMAHIINPIERIGLKPQCARYVDPMAAAMQSQLDAVMHSSGYTWATIPITARGPLAVYWIYAALDPILAVRLREHHWPIVEREAPKAYDIELATGWLADRMERKGVLIDRPFTEARQVDMRERFADLERQAREEFGVALGSADQVIDVLIRDKVDLWKRTAGGGQWSLDKEALAGITHPLIQLRQEAKRVEKLGSTYLRRFLEYSAHDGRLHPRINTLGFSEEQSTTGGEFGVKTSRMSMDTPNLQQLPRVDESDPLSVIVRNCVVAAPGHTFVMCDFDQIELRIMAHLSKDPGLAAAFATDEDFFTTLTREIYQEASIVKKDMRRNLTKSYTYATNYGAGNDRLAATTGRPLAEVEALDMRFKRTYAGVPQFQRAIQAEAAERHRAEGVAYVRSPYTNRRFVAEDPRKLYMLVNYVIQGFAAEIMKTKLLELDAAGIGEYMSIPVHDEEITEVPDDEVSAVITTFRDVMNDDQMLSVPLTAGVATGKRWGEKRDV